MSEPNEGHIVKRYDTELGGLRNMLLEMGGLVIDQVQRAVRALHKEDMEMAQAVVDRDHEVNDLDLSANEAAVKLIALRQPVATDLRLIVSVTKAVTDLERVGDEAAKIARMAMRIYDGDRTPPSKKLLRDIKAMSKLATGMLREALDAFDRMDAEGAMAILREDEELDNEFQSVMRRLATFVMEDFRTLGHCLDVVFVVKALERIGDHAKNIAEYLVYLAKGEDIRHKGFARLGEALPPEA